MGNSRSGAALPMRQFSPQSLNNLEFPSNTVRNCYLPQNCANLQSNTSFDRTVPINKTFVDRIVYNSKFNQITNGFSVTSTTDNCVAEKPNFLPFKVKNQEISPRSTEMIKQYPLNSQRCVQSVSVQTINPLKLSANSSTQTGTLDDDVVFVSSLQFLLHTEMGHPNLPIVQLALNKSPQNFLLDSGASISLLSKHFFNEIKCNVSFKRIASNVKITTVNSAVICSGCIQLTFKIGKLFYKHSFFLIDIPEYSKFIGILGFDFLKTHNVIIDLHNNKIKINNNILEILDSVSSQDVDVSQLQVNTISQINPLPPVPSTHSSSMNTASSETYPDDVELTIPDDSCVLKKNCHLKKKVIIPPQSTVYVQVVSSFPSGDTQFVFEPNIRESPYITFQTIVNPDLISSDKIPTMQFSIPVTNESDTSVHVNKNTVLGQIHEIEAIEEDLTSDEKCHPTQFCNLIHASPEILNLRKQEFKMEDFNLKHLPENQKNKLQELLLEYNSVFSSSMKALGHTDRIVPHIQFISDVPVRTLPFPVPQAIQEEAKKQLDMLIEAGIIERSISEWACPMLMVKKKSTSSAEKPKFRMALDLRLINSMIRSSSYPLPRIDTIINNISKYKFFTTLDFPSAYHQIHLPEEFRKRLSFTTQWGTYSFSRLMFGLRSAASSFQMLVDTMIDESKLQGVYAYQDDIIVASDSFEEMIEKLKILFAVLQKYNLTLSPAKCQFHHTAVDYLGFHIEDHTIRPITSNITKIMSFPVPKNKKQLKRFLGLCSFYRRLIPNYSKLMDPLIKLTSPKTSFTWSEEYDNIFKQVQKVFFSEPFLTLPDWSKTFHLNTDASGTAIAGVLLQERNNELLPVSYYSKSLTPSERNYPAIKLELMAIIKSINAFKFFLFNRHFTVLSDSKPLEFYKRTTSPADLTTRWLVELSNYDFTFKYLKGESNILADYFSREDFTNHTQDLNSNPELINDQNILPISTNSPTIELYHLNNNSAENSSDVVMQDPPMQISNKTFLMEQKNDPTTMKIIDSITSENPDPKFKNYFIHPDNGLLMIKRKFLDPENALNTKIIVPQKLKSKILNICHMPHFGIRNTYRRLLKYYYWYGIFNDTKNFVLSCTLCIKNKPHKIPHAPLQEMFIPSMPNELISLDFLGPFTNGFHVLTVIDHFTKHIEVYPIKSPSSQSVVDALTSYVTTYGRPAALMSDLGSQFTAHITNHFLKSLKVSLVHSSSGHPQTQGSSERINTSLKSSIATLANEGYNFKQALMIHKNLYNTTIHSSTGYSPAFLHFGRSISNIFDLFVEPNLEALSYPYDYYNYLSSMKEVYQEVMKNMKDAQQTRNQRQHKSAHLRKFQPGDRIFIKTKDTFKPRYIGPFSVMQVLSDVLISIREAENEIAQPFTINIDRVLLVPQRKQHLVLQPDSQCIFPSSNGQQTHVTVPLDSQTSTSNLQSTAAVIPKHAYNLRKRK